MNPPERPSWLSRTNRADRPSLYVNCSAPSGSCRPCLLRFPWDCRRFLLDRGFDIQDLDPSEALVLWLGGLPSAPGELDLQALSVNSTSPFVTPGTDTYQLFHFPSRHLTDFDHDGWPECCIHHKFDDKDYLFVLDRDEVIVVDAATGQPVDRFLNQAKPSVSRHRSR